MPTNVSTITIHAAKANVWNALTNPELVKKWQYGSDLQTTWQVGSAIKFRTEWEDKVFEQWGQVLEYRPVEFLQYSLFAPRPGLEDKPENYFIMSYTLSGDDGGVTLQIAQQDDRPNAVQEDPQGEENPVLKMLKSVAEGE